MENNFKPSEFVKKTKVESIKLEDRITIIKFTEEEKKTYGGLPFTDDDIRKEYAKAIMEYVISMDIVRPYNVEDFLNDCFEIADQWRIKLFENESPKSDLEKRFK